MQQFTIELDEMLCLWLEHISHITGQPIEKLIAAQVGNQIIALEEDIRKAFTESE